MANYPKKMMDPTEAALSAIEEALNNRDDDSHRDGRDERISDPLPPPVPSEERHRGVSPRPSFDESFSADDIGGRSADSLTFRAANDDQQSIGQILQTLQRRPAHTSYVAAGIFSAVWMLGCLALSWSYSSDLSAALGPNHSPAGIMVGFGAAALLPVIFFFGVAHMAWRSQELRLIAQVDGAGRLALGRARRRGPRFHRDRRTSDPPRGCRHG